MNKIVMYAKIVWNCYSIFKALRTDAQRYRQLRSKKRNPELFDQATDRARAKEELL